MNRKFLLDIFSVFLDTVPDEPQTGEQLADTFKEFMAEVHRMLDADRPPSVLNADDMGMAHYIHLVRLRRMTLARRAELTHVDLNSERAKKWPMYSDLKSYAVHWACHKTGGTAHDDWRSIDGGLAVPFKAGQAMELNVSVWCSKSTWHHLGSTCAHCGQKG